MIHHIKKLIFLFPLLWIFILCSNAQQVTLTPDQIKGYTPEWKGERFPDGRPKVSDRLLERLKGVHLEEAWGILFNESFQNQFEGAWIVEHPDSVMTGRVVTAQYMPLKLISNQRPTGIQNVRMKGYFAKYIFMPA